jgi:hypothetical protein
MHGVNSVKCIIIMLSTLFKDAVKCCDYRAPVIDERMSMGPPWNDVGKGKTKVHGEKPVPNTIFPHYKFRMDWPGTEAGPLQ